MRKKLWVLLIAGGLMATLTFELGQWQARRGDQKQALDTQRTQALHMPPVSPTQPVVDVVANRYRQARLSGHYLPGAYVLLDNRQYRGRPAVQWIQAFEVSGLQTSYPPYVVAVDRGLLLRDPMKPRDLPAVPAALAAGANVILQGPMLEHFARAAELWGLRVAGSEVVHQDGVLWSNFDALGFEKKIQRPLANFVVQALSESVVQVSGAVSTDRADTIGAAQGASADPSSQPIRVEPQFASEVDKHRGYAFQWRCITLVLVGLTGWLAWKERHGPVA